MPRLRIACVLTALGAALLVGVPSVQVPAAEPGSNPKLDHEVVRPKWAAAATAPAAAGFKKATTQYAIVHAEYTTAAAREAAAKKFSAVEVVHQYDRFVAVLLPTEPRKQLDQGFDELTLANGFVWLNVADRITPPPPPGGKAPAAAKRASEPIVRGGINNRTGKGVVVAIIDTGVDFRHPDFIRAGADGKPESRFIAIWDTTREFKQGVGLPGPIRYGNGAPVGTVFLRKDLTADLEKKALGSFDNDGHGTACAGIAAGNGAALKGAKDKPNANTELKGMDYTGVAPDADLIAVRVCAEEGEYFRNAWVLNAACDWLDKLEGVKDRPVVISCSYGGHEGGHDGSMIEERWLTAWLEQRPANGPARLVFFAAGNEAEHGMHAADTFTRNRIGKVTWELTGQEASIDLFIDAQKDAVTLGDVELRLGPGTKGTVGKGYIHPLTKSVVVTVTVTSSGSIQFSTPGAKALNVDAYIYGQVDPATGRKAKAAFRQGVSNARLLGTPASTVGAFAVGSYYFNSQFLGPKGKEEIKAMVIGKESPYSNGGYLRQSGVVKPDLVAPGNLHTAAVPDPVPTMIAKAGDVDMTGRYQAFNGTSAATPYAAGVAALTLESRPALSSKQYRELLLKALRNDSFTGSVPNPVWGYGKLDVPAVQSLTK
jgi:subtilisin family serine protease